MKKSTIIAKCLVKEGIIRPQATAEKAVRQVYVEKFPNSDFESWNQEIPKDDAQELLDTLEDTRLNINGYIEHLDSVVAPSRSGS